MTPLDRTQIAAWLQLLGLPAPQDDETDDDLRQRVAGALAATAAAVRLAGAEGAGEAQNITRGNRRKLEQVASTLSDVEAGYGVEAAELQAVVLSVNLMLQGMVGAGS